MDIEEIKLYLRIDGEEEDDLLRELQGAAEEYLQGAGIQINYNRKIYKLGVKLLVNNWYENRNSVLIGSISKELELSLRSIITQLKYMENIS